MVSDQDLDDDDFELPSTPHTIRFRNPIPPKPRIKHSSTIHSSQPKQQHRKQNTLPLKRKLPLSENGQEREQQPLSSQHNATTTVSEHSAIKVRKGLSLSLKKPTTKKPTSNITRNEHPVVKATVDNNGPQEPMSVSQTIYEDSKALIVLDSESEGEHEETKSSQCIPATSPELDLTTTQIGGVHPLIILSPSSTNSRRDNNNNLGEQSPSAFDMKCTQDSIIASSQGSDDEHQGNHLMGQQDYPTDGHIQSHTNRNGNLIAQNTERYEMHWSLSPDLSNPFLSDLVASPDSAMREHGSSALSTLEMTPGSTVPMDGDSPSMLEPQLTGSSFDPASDKDEALECVICGKMLAHLDRARIEYHINTCIDEQQVEQQTLRSLDLSSPLPKTPPSEGNFAGAQVDYLTRVKRCPICKQPWPLKGKGKAGSATQPKLARQKLEHMKRCAKVHNRTVQSLVYQIRLLKEQYERSIMLGTLMETDPAASSQDINDIENVRDCEELDSSTEGPSKKPVVWKAKASTITKKQVVSLSETADVDFASDAIVTTMHVPTPLRAPKLSKAQQLEQDQQDEGLQMALAISMSMESLQTGSTAGSRLVSPFNSSPYTAWPISHQKKDVSRKGSKRRRQTERERNETSVLPYAEVQHLIQANVQALLFPDSEDEATPPPMTSSQRSQEVGTPLQLNTPPWRPSRFSSISKRDLEPSLSQSSEPDATSPAKSLWKLSHLNDTQDIENFDLSISEIHDDDESRIQEDQGTNDEQTVSLDRERYSSRFMKRFIRLDSEGSEKGEGMVGLTESITGSFKVESEGQEESGSRQSDNKTFQISLKKEITSHLEAMVDQIQQAKLVAYEKILDSIKRHPIAAGLRSTEPPDIDISDEESELTSGDENSQGVDSYQAPSSPSLRYSNRFEIVTTSTISHDYHSTQHSESSMDRTSNIAPIGEAAVEIDETFEKVFEGPILENDNLDQYEEDIEQAQSAFMVYSPEATIAPPATPIRATNGLDTVDLEMADSPNTSFHSIKGEEDTSFSLRGISLPPPLDFAKFGFPNFLSEPTQSLSEPDLLPESPNQTAYSEDDQLLDNLDQIMATTPKRIGQVGGGSIGIAEKVPGRPKKTRAGLATPLSSTQQPKKNLLHGLPLLKSAAPATAETDNNDNHDSDTMDFEEPSGSQVISLPQMAPLPPSQATNATTPRTKSRVLNKPIPQTPSRATSTNSDRQNLSQLGETSNVSETAAMTPTGRRGRPPSKTPSKKKSTMVRRAEIYAAESAKAVASLRAQRTMPDYEKMSVPRLRLAATTFGLKSGRKRQLVDQLTAIWESVHADQNNEEAQKQNTDEREALDVQEAHDARDTREYNLVVNSDEGDEYLSDIFSDEEGATNYLQNRAKDKGKGKASMSLLQEVPSSQYSLAVDIDINLEHDTDRLSNVAESSTSHIRRRLLKSNAGPILGDTAESSVVSDQYENDEVEQIFRDDASEDEDEDSSSLTGVGSDDDIVSESQRESSETTPNLERQLYEFLNRATHFRKQFLILLTWSKFGKSAKHQISNVLANNFNDI
ncbi:hypothetical protein BGZ46_008065 [Entomortierella lignicola]|nr:hypothetical protein BGZ46_008065 [Entomortierella lignicola]